MLAKSLRTRPTPFTPRVESAGVSAYTVYNRMLLPAAFRSLEEDYHHLKSAVQIWDVSCERQVEICGPDAGRLVQMMTPRDVSKIDLHQCMYSPVCDINGRLLNDPVTIKMDEDRYWMSVADSDIILFAKGLLSGTRLNATVTEPDIFPLGIQGPKANELAARVFGDAVRDIRFFRARKFEFGGREHLIARSGYSGQGGFEVYLDGAELGLALWDTLMEAGRDLDVRAGGPNLIERIEAGLLSYGNDISDHHTPYEAGLGAYCHPDRVDSISSAALSTEMAKAPGRQIRYLTIDGPALENQPAALPVFKGGQPVGQITSRSWSPDHRTNAAIGMIDRLAWDAGTTLHVQTNAGPRTATVLPKPLARL